MTERADVTRPLEMAIRARFPTAIVLRLNSGTARSASGRGRIRLAPAGTPDLLVIVEGLVFGLETKARGGKLTKEQASTHKAWRRAQCIVETVDTVEAGISVVTNCLAYGRPTHGP